MRHSRLPITTAAVAAALLPAASADAAGRLTIRGAGFGHGVGMSQYGAYGFAKQGYTHEQILAHYYTGTTLGVHPATTVRVLLQSGPSTMRFDGARRAAGRRLSAARTYAVRRGPTAGSVELLSPSGRVLERVAAPLRVRGAGGTVRLAGRALNGVTDGVYRGAMEFRPGYTGVMAVNALDLEDYIRGVVARESPASWPAEALEAQAVAARTYAITTTKGGVGWDHYPDVRSQVYGGVAAETPTTDAAVAATARQVVTYAGEPVVTFFFSTSGGRTEDVENTSLGTRPLPWLKSVPDPYDRASPKHRWGPYRYRMRSVAAKLGSLVQGRLVGIDVIRRGRSPRIVAADVVGTRGRTRVTGATLRAELGLYDTWAYFTTIRTGKARTPDEQAPRAATGGMGPEGRAAQQARHRLVGRVMPARRGSDVAIQRRHERRWITVGSADTNARGRYAFTVEIPGRYRVKYLGERGPAVRVR